MMECVAVVKLESGEITIEPLGISASISEATRDWQLSHHAVSLLAIVRVRYVAEAMIALQQDVSNRGHLVVVKRGENNFFLENLGPGKDILSASRNWIFKHYTGAVSLAAILKAEYKQEVALALSVRFSA